MHRARIGTVILAYLEFLSVKKERNEQINTPYILCSKFTKIKSSIIVISLRILCLLDSANLNWMFWIQLPLNGTEIYGKEDGYPVVSPRLVGAIMKTKKPLLCCSSRLLQVRSVNGLQLPSTAQHVVSYQWWSQPSHRKVVQQIGLNWGKKSTYGS